MNRACEDRRGDLGAYVLHGLEPDEVADLERHLATCTRCRADLDELAALPDLLRLAVEAPPPVPADLRPRTLAGMPRRRRLALPAAAVVALVAALGATVVVALDAETDPPTVVLALPPAGDRPVEGEAGLVQVASGVRIELALDGLQPATEGYYHAWLTRGEYRVSAGTFVGDVDGSALAQLQCGGDLAAYDELVVTWHGRDADDEVVAVQRTLRG